MTYADARRMLTLREKQSRTTLVRAAHTCATDQTWAHVIGSNRSRISMTWPEQVHSPVNSRCARCRRRRRRIVLVLVTTITLVTPSMVFIRWSREQTSRSRRSMTCPGLCHLCADSDTAVLTAKKKDRVQDRAYLAARGPHCRRLEKDRREKLRAIDRVQERPYLAIRARFVSIAGSRAAARC